MRSQAYAIAAVAMLASAALAADGGAAAGKGAVTPNLDKGTQVLEGSGYVQGDQPVGTEIQLQLGYGYFVMDGLEIAALVGGQHNDYFHLYEFGGRAEYNFNLGYPVVPFVGAGVLWLMAEVDSDNIEAEEDVNAETAAVFGELGAKWFIRDDLALTFSAVFAKSGDKLWIDEEGEMQDTNVKGVFGVRFYFD